MNHDNNNIMLFCVSVSNIRYIFYPFFLILSLIFFSLCFLAFLTSICCLAFWDEPAGRASRHIYRMSVECAKRILFFGADGEPVGRGIRTERSELFIINDKTRLFSIHWQWQNISLFFHCGNFGFVDKIP